jgi:hypothetical protein
MVAKTTGTSFSVAMLTLVAGSLLLSISQAFAEIYQNTSYHYSIWYPSNWFVDGNGWSSIISLEPKTDSCKCTLLIIGAAEPTDVSLNYSKHIWTNQSFVFEQVKNVTLITFVGMPAYKIVYTSNPPNRHEMSKIVTVKNEIEYSLDFDARDPQLPVIQKMINSFRFTDSAVQSKT